MEGLSPLPSWGGEAVSGARPPAIPPGLEAQPQAGSHACRASSSPGAPSSGVSAS